MVTIFVDADGCPVKDEVYRVAKRYGLTVTLAADSGFATPAVDWITLVVVKEGYDAADDWIAEHTSEEDIVVTADIPLAGRCLEKGARVVSPKGKVFSDKNIGDALATRDLMSQLRNMGEITGGPSPFGKKDRSRFLQRLDEVVNAALRK